ncbi:M20/M25/M40 family metallo-hydrolase [Streptomyces sp. 1-11]|uniref:M20/M25/M40 family metallo-hydrolase n=1 Tax=Streptomyces sp. 1-11 TaxID=2590549 RepID=UPI00116D9365|nr:M20/M25/M40 family metallo-hydrolase [Streptomyces sp. 1-11]GEK01109.1 aminopeptidase [Streptomyces sp. 1-11]
MSLSTDAERSGADQGTGEARRRGTRGRALLALVLIGLTLLGTSTLLAARPPAARPADTPAQEFAAARALGHVRAVAQRPHPTGTRDNARVRRYLVDTARSLGAQVDVESGGAVRTDMGSPFPAGTVHNVIAKVAGNAPRTSGGKALLLVAHYDSVPTGPGAADDGSAVGAMLETMRALRAGGGVRDDVVFLFTDAEETGSLGAELFVRKHKADDYGAVLNWEARGSGGPVMMFETSDGNGPLVDAFAQSGTRFVTTSLAYEVYKRMPNGSDFTVFRDAGAIGLNSAFTRGLNDYHSPRDDVGRLSPDSVQHQGELMLGLVRGLGDSDLRNLHGRNSVYFDLFGRVLVRYPVGWAVPAAAVTLLGFAGLLVLGTRRSALRIGGVLATAGIAAGAVITAALADFGLWYAVTLVRPDMAALPMSEPYDRGWFVAGFLVLLAGTLLFAGRLTRGRPPAELIAGGLAVMAVLLAVVVLTVPGASYLLQWPLLAGLPALGFACRRTAARGETLGVLLAALAPAVAVVLFTSLVDSLLIALGVSLSAVAVLLAGTGGLLSLPLLARLPRPGLLASGAAAASVVLVGTGTVALDFSPRQPLPDSLVYVRDLARGTSTWMTTDPSPDDWTRRVLGDDPGRGTAARYFAEYGDLPVRQAKAPALDLPAPSVELLADTTAGGVRTVRFRVASQRDAWQIQVRLPRAPLISCVVAGQRMNREALSKQGVASGGVVFQFTGDPDGAELSCRTKAGSRLLVDASDSTIGLPPEVAALAGPRPRENETVPYGFAPADSSVVRRTRTL